jgi:hypothetical protein
VLQWWQVNGMSKPSHYRSYLLRLWRDHRRATWQASLQSTATEQIHSFPDVEQMWVFLKAQMAVDEGDPQTGVGPADGSERSPPD